MLGQFPLIWMALNQVMQKNESDLSNTTHMELRLQVLSTEMQNEDCVHHSHSDPVSEDGNGEMEEDEDTCEEQSDDMDPLPLVNNPKCLQEDVRHLKTKKHARNDKHKLRWLLPCFQDSDGVFQLPLIVSLHSSKPKEGQIWQFGWSLH